MMSSSKANVGETKYHLCQQCERKIEEGGEQVEEEREEHKSNSRLDRFRNCSCTEDVQVYVTMSIIVALAVIVTTVKILIESVYS